MKVVLNLFTVLLIIAVAGCNGTGKPSTASNKAIVKQQANVKQYTCPMDTDVVSNKPGVCPKCGMDLVEKEK